MRFCPTAEIVAEWVLPAEFCQLATIFLPNTLAEELFSHAERTAVSPKREPVENSEHNSEFVESICAGLPEASCTLEWRAKKRRGKTSLRGIYPSGE